MKPPTSICGIHVLHGKHMKHGVYIKLIQDLQRFYRICGGFKLRMMGGLSRYQTRMHSTSKNTFLERYNPRRTFCRCFELSWNYAPPCKPQLGRFKPMTSIDSWWKLDLSRFICTLWTSHLSNLCRVSSPFAPDTFGLLDYMGNEYDYAYINGYDVIQDICIILLHLY